MIEYTKLKETVLQVFTLRDLFWAVIGAGIGGVFGFVLDRLWSRIESKARFRIQAGGGFDSLELGRGHSITITNVGFNPLPEYDVILFHPLRGTMKCFNGKPSELVFPQHPDQWTFYCVTHPNQPVQFDFLKHWFLHAANKPIVAPSFTDWSLRLVLRNSERILFEDEGLGNSEAKRLFEAVSGGKVEQDVKYVFYKSKAPFWVELIRRYKTRRMLRNLGLK